MSGAEEKITIQGTKQKPDADMRNSPAFLAYRIGWLLFGAIAILGFSYFALWVLQFLSFDSDAKFLSNHKIINLTDLAVAFAGVAALVATIWALQLYWRLRYIDEQTEKWRPKKNEDEVEDEWKNPNPFTFHVLAESHKEWAQLWFAWCIAISPVWCNVCNL